VNLSLSNRGLYSLCVPAIYRTVSITIKKPFSVLRGLPQKVYLCHVKTLYLWTTHSWERVASKHYLVVQGSLQLSQRKFAEMRNLEKIVLCDLKTPHWFQKYIYSLPSLTTLEILWCCWPARPLPKPTFRLESLKVIFSESSALDLELMDACRDTLSTLQLNNRALSSLDMTKIIEHPPPALTHLKVSVSHDLDTNIQISRLLAACSTLTHLTIAEYTRRSDAITIEPGDLPKLEWFEGPVWYLEPILRGSLRPIHTYRQQQWVLGPPYREDELIEGIRLLASSANIIQELDVDILDGRSEEFEAEATALHGLVPHLKKWYINLSYSACVSLLDLRCDTQVFILDMQVWPFFLIPLLLQATNLEHLSISIQREKYDTWSWSWQVVHDLNAALMFGWLCIQSCRKLQSLVIVPPISFRAAEIVFDKVGVQEWVVVAPADSFPHPHGPYSEYRMVGRAFKRL
jgi:hypothetical protein